MPGSACFAGLRTGPGRNHQRHRWARCADPSGAALAGATVTIVEHGNRIEAQRQDRRRRPLQLPAIEARARTASRRRRRASSRKPTQPVSAGLGQKQTVNFTLQLAAGEKRGDGHRRGAAGQSRQSQHLHHAERARARKSAQSRRRLTYPLQFAPGALINTAGSGNDFVGGTNGYGNVQFNGLPALSNGYIVDGLETNDPLTNLNSGLSTNLVLGLEFDRRSDREHALLRGGPGPLRRFAGQLRHQVGHQSVSRQSVRVVERLALQRRGLLHQRHAGQSQAALHGEPFRRQPGRADPAQQAVLLLRQRMGADRAADRDRRPPSPRRRSRATFCSNCRWAARTASRARVYQPAPQLVPFYQKMFSLYRQHGGNAAGRSGMPVQQRRKRRPRALRPTATAAPTGRASRIRATITSRCRPRASTTTSTRRTPPGIRFQADTGLQAAYTDPINPLFDAVSPQPLYSFAAGYTHIFSSQLVNYFNPAFSWYESLFGPRICRRRWRPFRSCCEGSGANAPFTTLGGLDNTWVQGRRATRFFINDNLAWTAGAHDFGSEPTRASSA